MKISNLFASCFLAVAAVAAFPAMAQEGGSSGTHTEYYGGQEIIDGWWPWYDCTLTFVADTANEAEDAVWDGFWERYAEQTTRAIFIGWEMRISQFDFSPAVQRPDGRWESIIVFSFEARSPGF